MLQGQFLKERDVVPFSIARANELRDNNKRAREIPEVEPSSQEEKKQAVLEEKKPLWKTKFTVEDLKLALKQRGAATYGKKADLQKRYEEILALEEKLRKGEYVPKSVPKTVDLTPQNPHIAQLPPSSKTYPRKTSAVIHMVYPEDTMLPPPTDYIKVYTSLLEAYAKSSDDDIILINPGVYVLDDMVDMRKVSKNLEIIGNGPRGQVILKPPDDDESECFLFVTQAHLRIYNISIMASAGSQPYEGMIQICNKDQDLESLVELDMCDIVGKYNGINVGPGCSLIMQNSSISDCCDAALIINYRSREVLLQNNNFHGNAKGTPKSELQGEVECFDKEGYHSAIHIWQHEKDHVRPSDLQLTMTLRGNVFYENSGHCIGIRTKFDPELRRDQEQQALIFRAESLSSLAAVQPISTITRLFNGVKACISFEGSNTCMNNKGCGTVQCMEINRDHVWRCMDVDKEDTLDKVVTALSPDTQLPWKTCKKHDAPFVEISNLTKTSRMKVWMCQRGVQHAEIRALDKTGAAGYLQEVLDHSDCTYGIVLRDVTFRESVWLSKRLANPELANTRKCDWCQATGHDLNKTCLRELCLNDPQLQGCVTDGFLCSKGHITLQDATKFLFFKV